MPPAVFFLQRFAPGSGIIACVSLQVAGHQTETYRIQTDIYAGPLDLLLELIERAELDITRLALAQVTDQYLAYLRQLENRDPGEVSAFLVIAARLVQIKSAVLLPRPTVTDHTAEEEDDGEALARQLLQYRRFKQIAFWLHERQEAGLRSYLRLETPVPRFDTRLDLTGITLKDLAQLAYQAFAVKTTLPLLSQVVNMPRITIRDRILTILERLRGEPTVNFSTLLKSRTRLEVVITFLAMLELIKRRVVVAQQEGLFSEIDLQAVDNWEELAQSPDETEFGE